MKKALPLILLVVLAVIVLFIKQCNSSIEDKPVTVQDKKQNNTTVVQESDYNKRGLNRTPAT